MNKPTKPTLMNSQEKNKVAIGISTIGIFLIIFFLQVLLMA